MNLLGLGGLNKDSNGLGEAGADSKATREAVSALRNLTTNNTANCEAVQRADGLGELIVLLQAGRVTRLRRTRRPSCHTSLPYLTPATMPSARPEVFCRSSHCSSATQVGGLAGARAARPPIK